MTEFRERSGIFKFLYIVLSIITFPIFALIYIIKHPKWILFFIVLLGGVLAYFPLKEGENISNIVEWYKKKYDSTRLEIVSKALNSGNEKFIPKKLLVEAQKVQKELELKKIDDTKVKGENFNDKIVRDEEFEDIAVKINKKGGFKKKGEEEQNKKVDLLVEEGQKVGGLYELMQAKKQENEVLSDENNQNIKLDEVKEPLVENVKAEEDAKPQQQEEVLPLISLGEDVEIKEEALPKEDLPVSDQSDEDLELELDLF